MRKEPVPSINTPPEFRVSEPLEIVKVPVASFMELATVPVLSVAEPSNAAFKLEAPMRVAPAVSVLVVMALAVVFAILSSYVLSRTLVPVLDGTNQPTGGLTPTKAS